jgi:assimilatory nitrate reductase catalytic subunit
MVVPGAVDPVSGQPESKAAAVAVTPFEARWHGFAVSRQPIKATCDYWAMTPTEAGWRCECAGIETPTDWESAAREMFGLSGCAVQTVQDEKSGSFRAAFLGADGVEAALFITAKPVAVMRNYLAGLPQDAIRGFAPLDQPDPGPTICSCFGVGLNTILAAVEERNLISVSDIGAVLQAGTNCGSCRPELAAVLATPRAREAAE